MQFSYFVRKRTNKLKCNLLILYWSQCLYSAQHKQLVILLFRDFEDLRNISFHFLLCVYICIYFSTTNIIHMYILSYKRIRDKSITSCSKGDFPTGVKVDDILSIPPSFPSPPFPPFRGTCRDTVLLHKVLELELQHLTCLSSQDCHNKVPQSWMA